MGSEAARRSLVDRRVGLPKTTRRRFLLDAGAAGLSATLGGRLSALARGAGAHPSTGSAPARRRPTVAVLGGGVAGLSAAHELAERGFDVAVYERKELGGKAMSIPVPGTGRDGRRDLPGEHGFRFFPGFYHHIPDTMRRIPFPGNRNGIWDNLVGATATTFARNGGREDLALRPGPEALTVDGLQRAIIAGFEQITHLPPHELAFFARQVAIYASSSDERRFGQWEYVSWWDYTKADGCPASTRRCWPSV